VLGNKLDLFAEGGNPFGFSPASIAIPFEYEWKCWGISALKEQFRLLVVWELNLKRRIVRSGMTEPRSSTDITNMASEERERGGGAAMEEKRV